MSFWTSAPADFVPPAPCVDFAGTPVRVGDHVTYHHKCYPGWQRVFKSPGRIVSTSFQLYHPEGSPADGSPVSPIMSGWFVEIEFTWQGNKETTFFHPWVQDGFAFFKKTPKKAARSLT